MGVFGDAAGTQGVGVSGTATSATGNGIGVLATTLSLNGVGVQALSLSQTGAGMGGFFACNGPTGSGVFARSNSTTGTNYGVWGINESNAGAGVYGLANADSGTTFGVRGRTESAAGYAGYFEGRGYFSGNLGIGTTTPTQAPLVVATAVGNTNAQFGGPTGPLFAISNTPTIGFNLLFNGAWKYGGNGFAGALGMAQNDGHLYYLTAPSGTAGNTAIVAQRVTILTSGEVGIGTPTPTAKLHIGGTVGTDGIKFPDGSLQVRAARVLRRTTTTPFDAFTIAAGGSTVVTIGVLGATVGSAVCVNTTTDYGNGLVLQGHVQEAGVVLVRIQNVTAASINPPPILFAIAVFE